MLGEFLRDVIARNGENFRLFGPDETASNRLDDVFSVTNRAWDAETLPDGRPPRARRARDGSAVRASLPGLARGLSPHGTARALQLLRGVRPHRRFDVQPAREVVEGHARHSLAAPHRVVELPPVLPRLAAGPQRLLASGSRLHRSRREQEGGDHPRLPAARREHAPLRRRPLPAQPQLRQRRRRREAAGT